MDAIPVLTQSVTKKTVNQRNNHNVLHSNLSGRIKSKLPEKQKSVLEKLTNPCESLRKAYFFKVEKIEKLASEITIQMLVGRHGSKQK